MLIHQKQTHEVLREIVFRVTANRALHDDLTQEAFIHLWKREQERPGQTQSWYFQSCRFFLQNHLRNGRSVDSPRHVRSLSGSPDLDKTVEQSEDDGSFANGSILAQVSTREILALLARWLTPLELRILGCLADGLGMREIACRLNISHTCVIKYRRRIAALALKLGVEPIPRRNGRRHSPVTPARPAAETAGNQRSQAPL